MDKNNENNNLSLSKYPATRLFDHTYDYEQQHGLQDSGRSTVLNGIPSSLRYRQESGGEDQPVRDFKKKRQSMSKKKRVVLKDGRTNVTYKNISNKRRRYFSDLYTTLLDSSWLYCVGLFCASFYGSWLVFGLLYFFIAYFNGDLEKGHLPSDASDWIPCILEIDGFSSSFLYSLETQHTIGYGGRQPTTQCPEAILTVSVQAVLGCLIQAFMVGLVFSKLSRPRNRSKTVIFSTHAVIMRRNRKLCLIIRIGDLRDDNFILGTQIAMKILRRVTSEEGESFYEMKMLKIEPETISEPCVFFVWPLEIVHVIDQDSPFYDMSAEDLASERFELLVVLEGTNETSNMIFQARTSFLPSEILWGHRFEMMMLYRKDNNKFQINFSAFNSTYEVDTPLCSAKMLENFFSNSHSRKSTKAKSRSKSMIDTNSMVLRNFRQKLTRQEEMSHASITPSSCVRKSGSMKTRYNYLQKHQGSNDTENQMKQNMKIAQTVPEKIMFIEHESESSLDSATATELKRKLSEK